MKKLTIIFRRAPHGTAHGREALDLALLSASFEQEVSLIFVDEGVLHLITEQQPELAGAKDYIATFGALDLYDIETVLVCQSSLERFGLADSELTFSVDRVTSASITAQLQAADEVLVF
ncbi:sulfurtransferase complex subunit TusC [Shewanella violacea]|uniref:DsrE-related protein n=1 Tax=Shewanella violacea (strain JCM 10179 / CIP 106290 / LMG 19151 / DSS12) TaxID=637905 RepID=D4ZKR0_SHEVD|nr:sulfurtransferase complex subunit TusC [Shewanella violacea]BAJ02259.1 dsrE-related protein [Shewanella violacea DSS12]